MTKIEKIRTAVADYMQSEGCPGCEDTGAHMTAEAELAKLLDVPQYSDKSGWDFRRFQSDMQETARG